MTESNNIEELIADIHEEAVNEEVIDFLDKSMKELEMSMARDVLRKSVMRDPGLLMDAAMGRLRKRSRDHNSDEDMKTPKRAKIDTPCAWTRRIVIAGVVIAAWMIYIHT